MKKIKDNKEKGITLIALVVTIVVLIILATISINAVLGQNGIINKAKQAKSVYEASRANEITAMDEIVNEMAQYEVKEEKCRLTIKLIDAAGSPLSFKDTIIRIENSEGKVIAQIDGNSENSEDTEIEVLLPKNVNYTVVIEKVGYNRKFIDIGELTDDRIQYFFLENKEDKGDKGDNNNGSDNNGNGVNNSNNNARVNNNSKNNLNNI